MSETPGVKLGTARAFTGLMRVACSGTLCEALDRAFDQPLPREERASVPLAGGIMQYGYQCGMTWGAALAAGARAHRVLGGGPRAEERAVVAAQRLVEAFRNQNGHVDCLELTEIDRTSTGLEMFTFFFLKGGSIGCARRAARFAPEAFAVIEAALAEPAAAPPPLPLSCAAQLVRRAGGSDQHAVMAAGFAGGIGLGGGACGALGAALWLLTLRTLEAGAAKVDYQAPAALAVIERFQKTTDCEFECARIVGRGFEGLADHARYLRDGGCAQLIDALATAAAGKA